MIKLNRQVVKLFLLLSCCVALAPVNAAQQFQGLCSFIRIEIQQELALERIGFLATLEVTNNEGDAVLTDFSSQLTFATADEGGNAIDASDRFFVQPPDLSGINAIDGTGLIEPGETARVEWFIIPKIAAGGESQTGINYEVGAELAGALFGNEIDPDVLAVIPDTITVKPEPQLDITYFQPRDVDGDNPFTPDIVETPIPFTLGVLVNNGGFGTARKVNINSEQPEIVDNQQGLLVVPRLLGARINDEPVDNATLTVNLGDIEPGSCRKGAWDMITTLSGEFTEFNARYTHASELGGEATSIIRSLNAHFIVHEVINDQPGRDDLLDFLATTDDSQEDLIPDTLFETDCNTLPVNTLQNVSVANFNGNTATVQASADFENWVFMRLDDPAQAKLPIASVVRSDGKVLNTNNYWTNIRYDRQTNDELTYLNIFDNVSLGEYEYTINYEAPAVDTTAPVTRLNFAGRLEQTSDTTFILPDTQMFFIAEDDSPVGTVYRTDAADEFRPALPFTLAAGTYDLEFFSEDSAGNIEETQTRRIVVVDTYPTVTDFQSDVDSIIVSGDSLSIRPVEVGVEFTGGTDAVSLLADVEVYQGIFAWPTLSGIPSSPTSNTDAVLTVAGENVDFYRYRVGANSWSPEQAVSEPISLSGLSSGTVTLTVQARNERGVYQLDDAGDLVVSWQVSSAAPGIAVATPTTPSRSINANLSVSGIPAYRYSIDGSFFRPETAASNAIVLENLSEGSHQIRVIQPSDDERDPTDAVEVNWQVDRDYGLNFPINRLVYSRNLSLSNNSAFNFDWDGRRSNGSTVEPGWYTIKLTLRDGLQRATSDIKLVRVGNLLPGSELLSNIENARQKEVQGNGRWAVWQDQRNGSWNIFAKNIQDAGEPETALTNATLNQERPHTDGRYAVWQARQADGSWDIWAKDLSDTSAAFAVTQTAGRDETRPAVEWPWIIYQAKSVSDPAAAWQLYAWHLIDNREVIIDASGQDQLDPSINAGRVVWQDFRDVGVGEIYLKDLASDVVQRITDNTGGQFHPVIENQWVVWADNRDLQFDLYAYNLRRGVEIQLTDTPEDETRPQISGQWLVYEEDLAGEQQINLRALYLPNLASVQLTNLASNKEQPVLVSGNVLWTDQLNGFRQVFSAKLPDLQPVFNNRNMVVVTEGLLDYINQAGELLSLWQEQAGVVEITRYNQLLPDLISQTVSWNNGNIEGEDFQLAVGDFIWVKFDDVRILDFADSVCAPQDLLAGVNILSSSCFPDDYSAYQLLRRLDLARVSSIRALNAQTGRWQVATVENGVISGEDFTIPNITVVLVDLNEAVNAWTP